MKGPGLSGSIRELIVVGGVDLTRGVGLAEHGGQLPALAQKDFQSASTSTLLGQIKEHHGKIHEGVGFVERAAERPLFVREDRVVNLQARARLLPAVPSIDVNARELDGFAVAGRCEVLNVANEIADLISGIPSRELDFGGRRGLGDCPGDLYEVCPRLAQVEDIAHCRFRSVPYARRYENDGQPCQETQ